VWGAWIVALQEADWRTRLKVERGRTWPLNSAGYINHRSSNTPKWLKLPFAQTVGGVSSGMTRLLFRVSRFVQQQPASSHCSTWSWSPISRTHAVGCDVQHIHVGRPDDGAWHSRRSIPSLRSSLFEVVPPMCVTAAV